MRARNARESKDQLPVQLLFHDIKYVHYPICYLQFASDQPYLLMVRSRESEHGAMTPDLPSSSTSRGQQSGCFDLALDNKQ